MKKQLMILVLGIVFNYGNAQQKNDVLTAEFDRLMSEQFKPEETGATALVSRNGEIIYKKAFGMANLELNVPMDTDHIFRIGSITKQFTAVAILQLMEQQKLSLQDEITRFIPDFPTHGVKITIEHLLTHTSGIEDYTAMKDYKERMVLDMKPLEMINHFKNEPMKFAPGIHYSYSNSNYFLLGYIIEVISGETYGDYLDKNIFKPAGMTRTLYADDTKLVNGRASAHSKSETGFINALPVSMTQPYAAGSILSTVEDLFKWHQALITNKLIKKGSLEKAFTNYKLTDGKDSNYGYGWKFGKIYYSQSIWHGGAINGFGTMEIYLPKEDIFVTVFSNCDCNHPKDIASRMAALAIGKIQEYKEIAVPATSLMEYSGVYENNKGQLRIITVSENKLFSHVGRGPKSNLKPYLKDHFFFNEMQTVQFIRNKKGRIEKLETKNLNGNEMWHKSKKTIPSENGIKVNPKILQSYVGEYQVSPSFIFKITNEQSRLFLNPNEQEKMEMFAESPSKFFLKVNDAQFEFVKDESGITNNVIMNQGGRQANAKKIK